MHIIVCVKQVPNTMSVEINSETGSLVREKVSGVINPFDEYAIEESLRLRESFGGKITAISMGPQKAIEALQYALAMGVDEAILLSDPLFAGSDTWATSYVIAQAIRMLRNYDIILCGRQAIDGDTGQVGPGIAAQLAIPSLTYVLRISHIALTTHTICVERLVEEGHEFITSRLPALLTVLKDINQPRKPSFVDIRRSLNIRVVTWTARDIDLKKEYVGLEGSPTRVKRTFRPSSRVKKVDLIKSDFPTKSVEILVEKLLDLDILKER